MEQKEIKEKYAIRRLEKADKVKSFDCGDTDLNDIVDEE